MVVMVLGSDELQEAMSYALDLKTEGVCVSSFESVLSWARRADRVLVRGYPLDLVKSSVPRWQIRMVDRCLEAVGGIVVYQHPRPYDALSPSRDSLLPTVDVTADHPLLEQVAFVGSCIARINLGLQFNGGLGRLYESVGNVGWYDEPIFLVGERYPGGGTVGDGTGSRAFSRGQNSSIFLHRALDMLPEETSRKVYLTNYWKSGEEGSDELTFLQEKSLLRPSRIVALGKKVSTRLMELGIDHAEIPHPQHAARFFYQDIARYAEEIQAAIR